MRRTLSPLLPLLIAAFVLLLADMAPAEQVEINVGVRADASPFSFKASDRQLSSGEEIKGPLRREGYEGYMVYICDRVLAEMRLKGDKPFSVNVIEINAKDRFPYLREGRIDILCDPATITPERLIGLHASPPLFVSGITYASRPQLQQQSCNTLVGFVGATTAESSGISIILESGDWPAYETILSKYLAGDESWRTESPICPTPKDRAPPIRAFPLHDDVARAFCDSELLHYVGDLEIITNALRAQSDCKFNLASVTFTDERYAVFGNTSGENLEKVALLADFFARLSQQVLSNPSLMDAAFRNSFGNQQQSRKLQLFYWSLRGASK